MSDLINGQKTYMGGLIDEQKRKTFDIFEAALACVIFIVFNFVFLEIFYGCISSYKTNTATEIFGKYSNEYLLEIDEDVNKYNGKYSEFLKESNSSSLLEYYQNNCLNEYYESKGIKTYKNFYEYFVSNDMKWYDAETSEEKYTLEALYDNKFANYKSYIYNDLVNFINNTNLEIELDENDNFDGITYNGDFYAESISYYNFLTIINDELAEMKTSKIITYVASFLIEALFGVVAWIIAKSRKIRLLQASGMNKKVNAKIVFLAFLTAACSLILFSMLTYSFMDFLGMLGYKQSSSSVNINNFGDYIIYVIISCVTPAVCEEMLFRGVVLSGLKNQGAKVAIILSSIIFMLMHGSPDQTVHQFIVGYILGYIFYKSGNLWLGVLVHFFNNFISVTEVYILTLFTSNSAISGEVAESTEVVEEVVSSPAIGFSIELSVAIILASAGYFVVSALVKKMINESDRINGTLETSVNQSSETLLATGGVSQTTSGELGAYEVPAEDFTINSQDYLIETDSDNTSDKSTDSQVANTEINTSGSKKALSLPTKLMFLFSITYLVLEWLLSLISGF